MPPAPMQPSLKIVIVDENPIRAAILEDGLREAGHVHVVRLGETSHLLARIHALDPDVILIDLENPSRDVLEQMFQVSQAVKRPIAMFVDQSDKASIEAAVDAAGDRLREDGKFLYALDVRAARTDRYRPLPIRMSVEAATPDAAASTGERARFAGTAPDGRPSRMIWGSQPSRRTG